MTMASGLCRGCDRVAVVDGFPLHCRAFEIGSIRVVGVVNAW
jgi:hypothetical protein